MTDAEAEFEGFLSRYLPEVAAVGREATRKLRARLPTANVLVYDNYNALAAGFAPGEKSTQAILSVAFYPRWASLFFLQAATVDDPHGLLKGSGKVVKHIILENANYIDRPEISAMIDQAVANAKVPLDGGGEGRMIIKSVSAKQRPRRP